MYINTKRLNNIVYIVQISEGTASITNSIPKLFSPRSLSPPLSFRLNTPPPHFIPHPSPFPGLNNLCFLPLYPPSHSYPLLYPTVPHVSPPFIPHYNTSFSLYPTIPHTPPPFISPSHTFTLHLSHNPIPSPSLGPNNPFFPACSPSPKKVSRNRSWIPYSHNSTKILAHFLQKFLAISLK